MSNQKSFDLFVIGGGINGAGIARDAVGRGLTVGLCEMNDFASATSSASSKLIHGGLRYLEHYEFGLVRKALIEREVLLSMAPHIIWPLRFVLPHHKQLRPAWLLRLGLFLYDHMGGRKLLPPAKKVRFKGDLRGENLQEQFRMGFEYSDCWVDDARLVLLNIKDAANRGAEILKGWRCSTARREGGIWQIELLNAAGDSRIVTSRVLVNASGSWAADLANDFEQKNSARHALRLVKGSHIVLPQLYEGEHAYTFQEADGRIIFTIPYEDDFTLVGTTDVPYEADPAAVKIDENEKEYLCAAVSNYLKKQVKVEDILWQYSGVRPLVDDGEEDASQVTRDYVLALSERDGEAPLLSVFGGKVTTYRKLAEQALEDLSGWLPTRTKSWTGQAFLPGGELDGAGPQRWRQAMEKRYPWAAKSMLERMTRQYGNMMLEILGEHTSLEDLGEHFGYDLYEAELRYLRQEEWATSADDVLWRRTKLGLRLSVEERDKVERWFAAA